MSNLLPSIMEGVVSLYTAEAANVSSVLYDIPLYFNHAPEQKSDGNRQLYPLIIYNVIDSVPNYSMGTTLPNKYTVARIQISVYVNEEELSIGSNILDKVESILAFKTFTTSNNLMAIIPATEGINFPDDNQKIYNFTQDFMVYMGN